MILLLGVGCMECRGGPSSPLTEPRWFATAAEARAVAERERDEWRANTERRGYPTPVLYDWSAEGRTSWLEMSSDFGYAVIEPD